MLLFTFTKTGRDDFSTPLSGGDDRISKASGAECPYPALNAERWGPMSKTRDHRDPARLHVQYPRQTLILIWLNCQLSNV